MIILETVATAGVVFVLVQALLLERDGRRRTAFGRWHGEPDVSMAMNVRLMIHGPAARAVVIEAEREGFGGRRRAGAPDVRVARRGAGRYLAGREGGRRHGGRDRQAERQAGPPPANLEAELKAITLWQPWASLIADGHKTIETRDWEPPKALIGERLAIHAGKREPDWGSWEWDDFATLCDRYGWETNAIPRAHFARGAVVCTARLAGASKVIATGRVTIPSPDPALTTTPRVIQLAVLEAKGPNGEATVEPDPFGDFSVGRWLWFLKDVRKVDPPVSAKGRPGFWDVTPCDMCDRPHPREHLFVGYEGRWLLCRTCDIESREGG